MRFNLFLALITIVAPAFGDPVDPPSLSRAQMKAEGAEAYTKAAREMRESLKGGKPRTFSVDGRKFTGNYIASGELTDIYRVVEDGKVRALRIPRQGDMGAIVGNIEFGSLADEAEKFGLPAVKIYSRATFTTLITEVQFLEDFQSYGTILDEAAAKPNDPKVQARMKLLDEFFEKSGKFSAPSMHADQMGVGLDENRKPKVMIVDFGKDKYSVASTFEETAHARMLTQKRANFQSMPEGKVRTRGLRLIAESEAKFRAFHYPDEAVSSVTAVAAAKSAALKPKYRIVRPEEVPAPKRVAPYAKAPLKTVPECVTPQGTESELALKRTVGTAGNVMNFAGLVMAFLPESNPYAEDGIFCADAYAQRGRVKCEWDNALHPTNNYTLCSIIRTVKRTGKKTYSLKKLDDVELCSVTYDSVTFRMDDSGSKEKFKALDVFKRNGMQTPFKDTKSFFEDFKKKFKVTEPTHHDGIRYPESGGRDRSDYEA